MCTHVWRRPYHSDVIDGNELATDVSIRVVLRANVEEENVFKELLSLTLGKLHVVECRRHEVVEGGDLVSDLVRCTSAEINAGGPHDIVDDVDREPALRVGECVGGQGNALRGGARGGWDCLLSRHPGVGTVLEALVSKLAQPNVVVVQILRSGAAGHGGCRPGTRCC